MNPRLLCLALVLTALALSSAAQAAAQPATAPDAELRFVVYVSRHGVRSPTGKPEQYNPYSNAAWPAWKVPPGNLTSHGYHLMELFGAFDRMQLASEGLLSASGCDDAGHVSVHADSDQRTRETARALAAGMFPGCKLAVSALPEGTPDPLFHSLSAGVGKADSALAVAAIAGRIGNNPANLTSAYRSQFAELDRILESCGAPAPRENKRVSLFDLPPTLSAGREGHPAEMKGPLSIASTLTENILLEYTEGMDDSQVAWGCVDGAKLRSLINLHTASSDFAQRTKTIARMQASNLLDHMRRSLEQAVTGKAVAGAPSAVSDRALFLVGHDTNLTNLAGLLDLSWITDGRRDDTPPGGSLVFELWRSRSTGEFSVRAYYTAQTLEQMRNATVLSVQQPPERAPLALPGCGRSDLSCTWPEFDRALREAVDRRYVAAEH